MSVNWKPLEELTAGDIQKKPIWIYNYDNTIRSTNLTIHPNPNGDEATYIVLTIFRLNDGTEMIGYCSPADDSGIDYLRPVIIFNNKHVHFWDDESGQLVDKTLIGNKLSRSTDRVFPVKYSSKIICEGQYFENIISAT